MDTTSRRSWYVSRLNSQQEYSAEDFEAFGEKRNKLGAKVERRGAYLIRAINAVL